ncbi:hypothetical protein TNCV_4438031 [Trichonephila clavipes]|nr:hypothetical protein TNCV_4438031 [Trichonephila clavipes]
MDSERLRGKIERCALFNKIIKLSPIKNSTSTCISIKNFNPVLVYCLLLLSHYFNVTFSKNSRGICTKISSRDRIIEDTLNPTAMCRESERKGDHGSLEVKVTISKLACQEFEYCSAEEPSCRGDRCKFNMSRLKHPPVGVVWNLGKGMPAQVSPS